MSIRSVTEKPGSRKRTRDLADRDYDVTWIVISNTPNDTEREIERAWGIPHIGSPYVHKTLIDGGSQCRRMEIVKADPWVGNTGGIGYVWEVTAHYSTKVEEGGTNQNRPKDPIKWPLEIHWSSKRIEVYTGFDISGKNPLVNSAGDPFENQKPIEIYHAIASLTRMEAYYNPVLAMQFAGKVNSTTWFACPPHTARCEFPQADLVYVEQVNRYVWRITYSFEIAPEGWLPNNHPYNQSYIADRGRRAYVDNPTNLQQLFKPFPIRDELGNLLGEPAFLDGNGYAVLDVRDLPGNRPVMLPFRFYDTIDFNRLRLP